MNVYVFILFDVAVCHATHCFVFFPWLSMEVGELWLMEKRRVFDTPGDGMQQRWGGS